MTLTLELTPETEKRLEEEAARRGQSPTDIALRLLEEGLRPTLPAPDAENQALIDLLEEWEEEDARMTPEEAAQADAEWEALTHNINAYRAENGEEPVF